nr:phospholysine phosphohistidine inorganic pyrophosphate phosphatase isoform X4 [Anas platyrhynchos]
MDAALTGMSSISRGGGGIVAAFREPGHTVVYIRYYKETDGLKLDVGAYMKALEYACDVEAEVVGKPAKAFFESALAEMGVPPQEAIMIGDDIVSDVGGAQQCGMRAVQVRTGKYRARGGGGKEPPDSSAPWLPNTKRTRGGAAPGARCALHHGQAVSGRNQGTACRKPRGCCAVRPVSEDRLGEVSSVLSKPVLAPQPEPEHATGLGCLAGLSYLQIVMTGTEKKKLN